MQPINRRRPPLAVDPNPPSVREGWPEVPLEQAFAEACDQQVNDAILTREFLGERLRANRMPANEYRPSGVVFSCWRDSKRIVKQSGPIYRPDRGWVIGMKRVERAAGWLPTPRFFASISDAMLLMASDRWPDDWALLRFGERWEVFDVRAGKVVTTGSTPAEAISWAALWVVDPTRLGHRPPAERSEPCRR